MLHKAWNSKGEVPYCFLRSSIKFQGHTGQNITDFDPNWAFPDYRPVAAFKSLRFALFMTERWWIKIISKIGVFFVSLLVLHITYHSFNNFIVIFFPEKYHVCKVCCKIVKWWWCRCSIKRTFISSSDFWEKDFDLKFNITIKFYWKYQQFWSNIVWTTWTPMSAVSQKAVNTLRPRRNEQHFAEDIFKRIFSMKMFEFRLKFHWSLLPRVELTIFQHWFR